MGRSFRMRTDVVYIFFVFFVVLTVFSTVDQYASRLILLGFEVPWYEKFKLAYNVFLVCMVLFFIVYAVWIVIKEKDEQIEVLKTDVIRAVVHVKKLVELQDVLMVMEPESAIECRTSEEMIRTIQSTSGFKEIESKLLVSKLEDVGSESILFSDQLLAKYKPQTIAAQPLPKAALQTTPKLIKAAPATTGTVTVGLSRSTELVKEMLDTIAASVAKLGEYHMYFVQYKKPIFLERLPEDLEEDDEDYEEYVKEHGVHSAMILAPGEFYKVLKFKHTKIYDREYGEEIEARVANASLKFIRYVLPKLPMLVINDCSLTNDTFWEITFNNEILADSTIVAMSFLTYFAIDEAEDLRTELQKSKVKIVKLQSMLDARKDELIEEVILNGELKNIWRQQIRKTEAPEQKPFKLYTILLAVVLLLFILYVFAIKPNTGQPVEAEEADGETAANMASLARAAWRLKL